MDSSELFEEYNSLLDGALKPKNSLAEGRENGETSAEEREHSLTTNHENGEESKLWIPEVKRVIQFKDLRGNVQIVPLEKFSRRKLKKPAAPRLFSNYAILQRKVLRVNGSLEDFTLEIQSDGLQQLFKKIATPYSEVNLEADPIVLRPPFRCLFFLREDLEALSNDASVEEATQKELRQILEFIKSDTGIQRLITDYDSLVPTNRITFDLLWTLFPPRELVYIGSKEGTKYPFEYCAFVESTRPIALPNQTRRLEITLLLGFHNGLTYGIVGPKLAVNEFFGIVDIDIQNLNAIPFSKLPEKRREELRARFIQRGKRYIDISKASHSFLHYDGPITLPESESAKRLGEFQPTGYSYSGFTTPPAGYRVIVDKQIQEQLSGLSELKSLGPPRILGSIRQFLDLTKRNVEITDDEIRNASWGSMIWRNPGSEFKLQDEDYLICFPKVIAFVLQQKCWADYVHLDGLVEIAWKEDPFLSLQLPSEHKLLIKALVSDFGNDSISQSYDIIEGKGKGLIFLLHGPPGLGKTLTAESVAETTRRPLYHVSTGELSTEVTSLEKQLVDIFRLGSRWGAVVLLDEADVLMQKRTTSDLQRNAIVAVFLRMLEYYNGMLFVTTNRLTDFDQAFQNRIHLSIAFDILEAPARTNIWRQHISRTSQRCKATRSWTEEMFGCLGQLETNGRDIRNFTRTSDAYARSNGEDLALRHVITVIRNNFNREQLAAQKDTIQKLSQLAVA